MKIRKHENKDLTTISIFFCIFIIILLTSFILTTFVFHMPKTYAKDSKVSNDSNDSNDSSNSINSLSSIDITIENCKLAADYSESSNGISFLVMQNGVILYEQYSPKIKGPNFPVELASATKSFCGIIACMAETENILKLDELACETLTEWRSDPLKSKITIRNLLTLTSGLKTGGEKGNVPTFLRAINMPMQYNPGEKFQYGATDFQVFGELMKRKLNGKDPVDYLNEKILSKIGSKYFRWKKGQDGNPHLSSGAAFTARNLAIFGEFVRLGGIWNNEVIIPQNILDQCFVGTKANPTYGLTWWLNAEVPEKLRKTIVQLGNTADYLYDSPIIPKDLVMAAGAGKQRLYIIRSLNLVIVRQGDKILDSLYGRYTPSFSDKKFLSLLLTGKP